MIFSPCVVQSFPENKRPGVRSSGAQAIGVHSIPARRSPVVISTHARQSQQADNTDEL